MKLLFEFEAADTTTFDYHIFKEKRGFKEVVQTCKEYKMAERDIVEVLSWCHQFEINLDKNSTSIEEMFDLEVVQKEVAAIFPIDKLTFEDKERANKVYFPKFVKKQDGTILYKYVQPPIDNENLPFYGTYALEYQGRIGYVNKASIIYACWSSAKILQAAYDVIDKGTKPIDNVIGMGFTVTGLTGSNSSTKAIAGISKDSLMMDLRNLYLPFIRSLSKDMPSVNNKPPKSITVAFTYLPNLIQAAVVSMTNNLLKTSISTPNYIAQIQAEVLIPSRSIAHFLVNFKNTFLKHTPKPTEA